MESRVGDEATLITVQQLAVRYRLKVQVINDLIRLRIFNERHGFVKVGGMWLIAIDVFKSKIYKAPERGTVVKLRRRARVFDDSGSGAAGKPRPQEACEPHLIGESDAQARTATAARL